MKMVQTLSVPFSPIKSPCQLVWLSVVIVDGAACDLERLSLHSAVFADALNGNLGRTGFDVVGIGQNLVVGSEHKRL